MRKVITFIIANIFLLNLIVFPACAADDTAVFRLQTLGIIDEYSPEHLVTRAEAVNSFVKLLINDAVSFQQSAFSDVPAEHKYADEINYAREIGMVSGTTDGLFNPDEPVLGMHVAKMAVITLGHQQIAEREGGYEDGYVKVAAKQRLLTGYGLDEAITMAEFVVLLDEMLDMYPLEPGYTFDGDYVLSTSTFYELKLNRSDMTNIYSGIVTAVGKSVLNGYSDVELDEISIDGKMFSYKGENALNLLGQNVNAYYQEESSGKLVVTGILPKKTNEEISIDANDINVFTNSTLSYYNGKKNDTVNFSGASFIYNGINYSPESNISLKGGFVRLVNNDNDNDYDVVFINEEESFIVDRVSVKNTTIFLKNGEVFRGKSYLKMDYEDEDRIHYLSNAEGVEITVADIKANDVVTFMISKDEMINNIKVSSKIASGKITEIAYEDEYFVVDGEKYGICNQNKETIYSRYAVGDTVTFYVNYKDEIVGGDIGVDGEYGYVIGAAQKSMKLPQIKLIPSGESEKVIETVADTETIKYNYQNGMSLIFDMASKVKYTGKTASGSMVTDKSINSKEIDLAYLYDSVVRYKLNKEGEVSELETIPVDINALKIMPKFNFNGKLNSLGGIADTPAFYIGENTNVICVPEKNAPEEDDFYVDVTITDKSTYTVMGVNVDEETQIAECVLLIRPMDSTQAVSIPSRTKYSIVGKTKVVFDEDREEFYKLEVLTGTNYETPYVSTNSDIASKVSGLKTGDVIRYVNKMSGEIGNIQKIDSMYAYKDVYGESLDGKIFGLVEDVELNRLDDFLNEKVDKVTLSYGGVSKQIKLLREDGPSIYSYNKSSGEISVAEPDEITPGLELFLYTVENTVKICVIFIP